MLFDIGTEGCEQCEKTHLCLVALHSVRILAGRVLKLHERAQQALILLVKLNTVWVLLDLTLPLQPESAVTHEGVDAVTEQHRITFLQQAIVLRRGRNLASSRLLWRLELIWLHELTSCFSIMYNPWILVGVLDFFTVNQGRLTYLSIKIFDWSSNLY